MARSVAVTGSLVVHGAIALVAMAFVTHVESERRSAPPGAVTIEVASAAPPAPSSAVNADVPVHATPVHATPVPRAPGQAPTAAARVPRPSRPSPSPSPLPPAPDTTTQIEPTTGALRDDGRPGEDGMVGPGLDGEGRRSAGAHSIGLGGARIDPSPGAALPPVPVAPPPSKARPPRLIYPVRERDADEALHFVMRVTVDTDGFVVAADLLRRPDGHRDDADVIWRFRYQPALDDDGRPIKATIVQQFLVE